VTTRELDAAGITDPAARLAYERCRRINARHGKTYFLATRLLPPAQRPAVHALYGFARWADEIVDAGSSDRRGAELDTLERQLDHQLAGRQTDHPVLAALVDTIGRYRIDRALFTDFLASMRMDLTVTEYADMAALSRYTHGSAAVIGLQMLPVLGTVGPLKDAEPGAAALGVAFQLTNFLRDIGEDLDRGRLYLPLDVLTAFGVDRALLQWCKDTGKSDQRVRRALAHLAAHTYAIYREAEVGVAKLRPVSRPCIGTALTLYRDILDGIVAADYQVFTRRVVVPTSRRLAVALPGLVRAVLARTVRPGVGQKASA
jgi:phytoene synthase